jgi:hypothetical protein
MLNDGDHIAKTQSAVVIEKLISQFLFDKAHKEAPANEFFRSQHRIDARRDLRAAGRVRGLAVARRPVRAVEPRDVPGSMRSSTAT